MISQDLFSLQNLSQWNIYILTAIFIYFKLGKTNKLTNVQMLCILLWDAVPRDFKLHEDMRAFWISLNILKIIKFKSLHLFTAFNYLKKAKKEPKKQQKRILLCSLLMAPLPKYYKPHFCLKMNVVSVVAEWHYINQKIESCAFSPTTYISLETIYIKYALTAMRIWNSLLS